MSDKALALRVPKEIEGPAEGVAKEIGGQAAVEGAERRWAFGVEETVEDTEGWKRVEETAVGTRLGKGG